MSISFSLNLDNCSCGTLQSVNCIDLLIIGNDTVIDGMFIGCLPITSLRLSTLECFYNETCLNQIQQVLSLESLSMNVLDSFQSSRYSVKTTLNYIIDNLMLENWTFEINYTAYSNACNFEKCSYSMMIAKDPLSIFTNLLGLCKLHLVNKCSIYFCVLK